MPSKLMKRAIQRESVVQALAFDKTPGARQARIAKATNAQWLNRTDRGEFKLGIKRNGACPRPDAASSFVPVRRIATS